MTLRTDVVEREGQAIYRINDRFNIDLERSGSASMTLRADLLPDLSALELSLETEEPRGGDTLSRQRVTLTRGPEGWVRTVVRGSSAPETTTLGAAEVSLDTLWLTPPLGVGERLERLAQAPLGARLSAAGHDVETGQPASWRISVEDRRYRQGAEELQVSRAEGAAALLAWRGPQGLTSLDLGPRLSAGAGLPSGGDSPRARVVLFLRAMVAGEVDGALSCVDVDALYHQAGGDPADAGLRAQFEQALRDELLDGERWRTRGWIGPAAARGEDFAESVDGEVAEVWVKSAPARRFALARRGAGWVVVGLPRK
ncbi:MAG: hypothetical protein KDD82_31545 [Planctomycetes bacterium]|nr:hypothetical protein [Planctomycetota bacterium]